MRARHPSLLLLPMLAACGGSGAQETVDLRADSVHRLFAEQTEGVRPGLAVAVVREGEVLLREGYGMADLEHRIPITPSTVFDVASVSKQFTGLAVSMLIEEGRIGLDDDIREHLPELGDFTNTITVDHLLHHTSGLRDWPGTLAVAGWRMDDVIAFDQILRMAYDQHTLNFEPGAEYTYSNTGYNLLAEMVARVTGQSFRAWMRENLFEPLGMEDTHFHDDHTEVDADRALGYSRAADGYRATPNNLTALGSSSLYGTVDDLAKWVVNFEDARVGGRFAMQRTRTRGVLNDGSEIPYAFGISHGEYRGLSTVGHSGGWASFSTYLVHFPEQRFGVVVLANGGGTNAQRAAYDVADVYLEDALLPDTFSSGATAEAVEVDAATLDDYVGLYRLGPGWYVEVMREGRALFARATGEERFPMTARSEAEFRVEAYGASIVFGRDSRGRVTHFDYRGRRAPKVEERAPSSAAELTRYAGVYESDELATRYTVAVDDGTLVMRHYRHGEIALTPLWKDDFRGSVWFMPSVEFFTDASGAVTGLLVNAGERNRDIRFARLR